MYTGRRRRNGHHKHTELIGAYRLYIEGPGYNNSTLITGAGSPASAFRLWTISLKGVKKTK